jgi:hypothetical protein
LNYDGRWNHVIVISGEIGSVVARSLCHVISFDEYFDRQSSTTVGIYCCSCLFIIIIIIRKTIESKWGLCHELFQSVFFSVWLSMIKSRVVATTTNQPRVLAHYIPRPPFFLSYSELRERPGQDIRTNENRKESSETFLLFYASRIGVIQHATKQETLFTWTLPYLPTSSC